MTEPKGEKRKSAGNVVHVVRISKPMEESARQQVIEAQGGVIRPVRKRVAA